MVQLWPARMATPSRSAMVAMSCGWMPSITNETTPARSLAGGPNMRRPGTSVSASIAYSVSSRSWARMAFRPTPSTYSSAAPSPITSAIAWVPASNFSGRSAKVVPVVRTALIMSPPPRNGGIASSSSRRPYSTPMPVGPHILWLENA